MNLDIAALRAQTPGCAGVLHLNNAGMALPTRQTLDRVVNHLHLEAEVGGYRAAWEVEDEVEAVYGHAAALLGARPDEIALVDSATRAWNLAITSIDWRPGDRIIVGTNEYGSNMIALLHLAARRGVEIVVAPERADGEIDLPALEALLDGARLLALTHVGTNSGLIQPAAAVGALAAAAGVPYLLDACQSVGQLPVDVGEIGCTMLAATGRKYLRGPRGTGFLWVHSDHIDRLIPATPDARGATWTADRTARLRPDARRFELWERSVAGVLGLGVALRQLNDLGIHPVSARIRHLADQLRQRLTALPGVTVHDRGTQRCGLVSFTVDGQDPSAVRSRLRARGINVSVSSQDMTRLDMAARRLPAVLRASPHAYNTVSEVRRLTDEILKST